MPKASGKTSKGIAPKVGFSPIAPTQAAGMRIEPPPSVPSASGATPAASAALPPPVLPPGVCARRIRRVPEGSARDLRPLVDRVEKWPAGPQEWLMAEVPPEGSLTAFFRDLEKRLASAGSLWVVFPKKPFLEELSFPYSWTDVQKAGLGCGLVDTKIAAFSARLTSIRFVIPIALRKSRPASGR